jgi:hypothetical protein
VSAIELTRVDQTLGHRRAHRADADEANADARALSRIGVTLRLLLGPQHLAERAVWR